MTDKAIIVPAPVIPDAPPASAPAAPAQAPAASPAASPAAAPAAPASPAAAPAQDPPVTFEAPTPAAPTPPQDNVVVYEKTGDPGLDVALRYVGQRGFGPEHPAVQAATKGDFTQLETALKALGAKADGYAEYVGLAKDAYGRRQAAAQQKAEAASKVIYDAVGGKEKWAAIHAWVAENADQSEKDSINAAFKAGGIAAKTVAAQLASMFAIHGKTAPKAAVKAEASAAPPAGAAPLTLADYSKAVKTLHAQLGSRMEGSKEYADLKARRAAARR